MSHSESHPPAPASGGVDPVEALNLAFRGLYAVNREELFSQTPLAALTLIGTGEIWRVEFGRVVKSYPPTPWLSKVKGLFHAVIGTQAVWARLLRRDDDEAARAGARLLEGHLREAVSRSPVVLPPDLAPLAQAVLTALHRLAEGWAAGRKATPDDLPAAMESVGRELDQAVDLVGEAVYQSVVRGLRAFIDDSAPEHWSDCLVGVCGVAFGRRDNVEIAAAMSLMGKDAVGERLLYLENALTIPEGLKSLAAALADRELGRAVFRDPDRMWRDLLGDVAARHAGGGFFPALGR